MQKPDAKLNSLVSILALAASVFSTGVTAEDITVTGANQNLATKSELLADYAQPVISLDEVINPSSSMEGDYPVHTYGELHWSDKFFWMDNNRLIFSHDRVIGFWDVNNGKRTHYGFGDVVCYADGMIKTRTYESDSSPNSMGSLQRGLLGYEKRERIFDKTPRIYGNKFECSEPLADQAAQYAEVHLDEMITPLREEHGFLVTAKRTMFPDGRTKEIIHQNQITFHRPGKEPINIPVYSRNFFVSAYYPFLRAYLLGSMSGVYILHPDGDLQRIDSYENNVGLLLLSRRGLLWLRGSVLPQSDNGLYLSHGEQVKRISSENAQEGKVSPNGCRMAYTTTRVDFFGKITQPTLKVIDLCKE